MVGGEGEEPDGQKESRLGLPGREVLGCQTPADRGSPSHQEHREHTTTPTGHQPGAQRGVRTNPRELFPASSAKVLRAFEFNSRP